MKATNGSVATLPLGSSERCKEHDGGAEASATVSSQSNLANSPSEASWVPPLCIATFTHSWLLISVFPYSGFMAIWLVPSLDEENAGSYAGLLASAFMCGRAATAYGWGQIADIYGRRFVLLASLAFSSIFSILFGFSTSFGLALLWRFMLGLSNGMVGTAKTAVSELSGGNQRLETHSMSIGMSKICCNDSSNCSIFVQLQITAIHSLTKSFLLSTFVLYHRNQSLGCGPGDS